MNPTISNLQIPIRMITFGAGLYILATSGIERLPNGNIEKTEYWQMTSVFCLIYGSLGIMAFAAMAGFRTFSKNKKRIALVIFLSCVLPQFIGVTIQLFQIIYCTLLERPAVLS